MKAQLSFEITLLILTFQSYPQNMQEYLRETNEMVREGNYQEALERHLWFHDHALEHDPAFSGVRLSFALMYWNTLGEVYPPAKIAMIEVRDKKTEKIKNGEGSFYLFQDVTALNRTLKEDSSTVELFYLLDDKQPELAKKCWKIATEPVIMFKEYELAKKYGYNPLDDFNELKNLYEYQLTRFDTSKYVKQFETSRDNHFIEESLHLIEVALELGDENAAKEIQEKAFTVLNDERLHDAIK